MTFPSTTLNVPVARVTKSSMAESATLALMPAAVRLPRSFSDASALFASAVFFSEASSRAFSVVETFATSVAMIAAKSSGLTTPFCLSSAAFAFRAACSVGSIPARAVSLAMA